MSLFEIWSGKITIPALPSERIKVGRNIIFHAPTLPFVVNATISDLQQTGYSLLKTDAPAPFDEFYIREKRAKRKTVSRAVLTPESTLPLHQWDDKTDFRWDDHSELMKHFDAPEKVTNSWQNQFRFQMTDPQRGLMGLRMPQIGALHAILAHFAVGLDHEPATVVLPTGTGKTETMLAALGPVNTNCI